MNLNSTAESVVLHVGGLHWATTAHGVDPDAAAARPVQIPHPNAAEATGWARCTRVTDPLARPEDSP